MAADLGHGDAVDVYRAIQRRCPGVLFIHARYDELSRDQYEDVCHAVESELSRRPLKLEV
jgi:hypothetical protein